MLRFSGIHCGIYYTPDAGGIRYSVWYSILLHDVFNVGHITFHVVGLRLGLGLWCLTPLSTIFQVFQVVHITLHMVRISGVPCCTTKNITSVLKLSQKSTIIVLC